MEEQDERELERLHHDSARESEGDRDDNRSDSGLLSSADSWVEPGDPEAFLPYISEADMLLLVADILRYVVYQHRRGVLERLVHETVESLLPEHEKPRLREKVQAARAQ